MQTKHYLDWLKLLICLLLLSGCSLSLIADYDEQTLERLERIERDIEHLYLSMQTLKAHQRQYNRFSGQYLELEINIRSMKRRQARRKNNSETLQQANILVQLWQQDMLNHQKNKTLSDFLVKRRMNQYQRLMNALITGELAKQ